MINPTVASSTFAMQQPIAISQIGGRYLLFDINAITHLRRVHNLCGVLVGGVPQAPQQNVFLGLPVELLAEEVHILVAQGKAYIVDDCAFHKGKFAGGSFKGQEKSAYLQSLRAEGRKARIIASINAKQRAERGLARSVLKRSQAQDIEAKNEPAHITPADVPDDGAGDELFARTESRMSTRSDAMAPHSLSFTVTRATTNLTTNGGLYNQTACVPVSSPLYAHLQRRKYFLTPGLRFGGDYTVYPGDPLRFHSHFIATGYEWDQEIPLIDIVAGGRLGTGVKKGFLVGGLEVESADDADHLRALGDGVRTFCIEWGGM